MSYTNTIILIYLAYLQQFQALKMKIFLTARAYNIHAGIGLAYLKLASYFK